MVVGTADTPDPEAPALDDDVPDTLPHLTASLGGAGGVTWPDA